MPYYSILYFPVRIEDVMDSGTHVTYSPIQSIAKKKLALKNIASIYMHPKLASKNWPIDV